MWDNLATWFAVGLLVVYIVVDFTLSIALGYCVLPGLRCGACKACRERDERLLQAIRRRG